MTALTITLALVAVVGAALALLLLVAWRRALTLAVRRQSDSAAEAAALRERLDALEAGLAALMPASAEHEYVITRLGELEPAAEGPPAPVTLTAPAFADAVVRETVVQTASFVHGVRRALAPEARHRIRFEMKREVKRTRKARKVEAKEALREYRARRRADQADQADQADRSEGAA